MSSDPHIVSLFGVGILVLLVAWLPLALRAIHLSLAIICVGLGAAVFSLDWFAFEPDPRTHGSIVERLTEAVVIIALMGAGLKLDRPIGLRAWATTWRPLGLVMPLPPQSSALNRKPVGIIGASPGITGAARAQSQLRQAFEFTNSYCMAQPEILIARAHEKFDAEGRLTDGMTTEFLRPYLVAFRDWILRFT